MPKPNASQADSLRDYLKLWDADLANAAEHLWAASAEIHDKQTSKDSQARNGREHVKAVEEAIWLLLRRPTRVGKADNLDIFDHPISIFLLSAAACCHDFDKSIELPNGMKHGEGSAKIVNERRESLGLTRPQSDAIQQIIRIHDSKKEDFLKEIERFPTSTAIGSASYNPQFLAVLFKTADILHTDNSRTPVPPLDAALAHAPVDAQKHLYRYWTNGWRPNGDRIEIETAPSNFQQLKACRRCFHYMKTKEWPAVSSILQQKDFPSKLVLTGSDFPDPGPFLRVSEVPFIRGERVAYSEIPLPSLAEYSTGCVPMFEGDAKVRQRLAGADKWAFVLDCASTGKTTLALRIATSVEDFQESVYYLDLRDVQDYDPEVDPVYVPAMDRLTPYSKLLIIDNSQHAPELAEALWNAWRRNRCDSQLLIMGTEIDAAPNSATGANLAFFKQHDQNPPIRVRPTAQDLGNIVKYIYRQSYGEDSSPLEVPPGVLEQWHQQYECLLGAFCFAVLYSLRAFRKGEWSLLYNAAASWVQGKWLRDLDVNNLENLLCISVFDTQELELSVNNEALPYPGRISQLLRLGLIARTGRGAVRPYYNYCLRVPSWGKIILAADDAIDPEKVLCETASRHFTMAATLSTRLRREVSDRRFLRLWAYIAESPDKLKEQIPSMPLLCFLSFVNSAKEAKQVRLADQFWRVAVQGLDGFVATACETPLHFLASFLEEADAHDGEMGREFWQKLESESEKIVAHALNTQLHFVVAFLERAKKHKKIVEATWDTFAEKPEEVVACAWKTPLGCIGLFLNKAKEHKEVVDAIWHAFEEKPEDLVASAWNTQLHFVAAFLEIAKGHKKVVNAIWKAFEEKPEEVVACAWRTPLNCIGLFLNKAKEHKEVIDAIWHAFEENPEDLVASARNTQLHVVGAFLEVAKGHKKVVNAIWKAFEEKPEEVVACAWRTPLNCIGLFLNKAKEHKEVVDAIWYAFEEKPEEIVACAWTMPLNEVGTFLEAAKEHKKVVDAIWKAFEEKPEEVVACAWNIPLNDVGMFLEKAKGHKKVVDAIWEAFEKNSEQVVARAWDTPLSDVGWFLVKAKGRKRVVDAIWEAFEKNPKKVMVIAWQAALDHVGSFLRTAKAQGRDTSKLWEALERESEERLAQCAWRASLDRLGSFLRTAKEQGRDMDLFRRILSTSPVELSASAKRAALNELAGFLRYAPDCVVRIAVAEFQPTHWDQIPVTEPMQGARWVAERCSEVGRDDIKSALVTRLLHRACSRDFSPQADGLVNVAWLLKNIPSSDDFLVDPFLNELFMSGWLRWQFSKATPGALAAGLRMLAFHQTPQVIRRFHSPDLGVRIRNEFLRFNEVDLGKQIQVLQFLGCAYLCRGTSRKEPFDGLHIGTIENLFNSSALRDGDMPEVENWAFQLWLGLRAFCSLTGEPLPVSRSLIAETLSLWNAKLQEENISPMSAEYRVKDSMVAWLEECQYDGRNYLLPETDPLWVHVGFHGRLDNGEHPQQIR